MDSVPRRFGAFRDGWKIRCSGSGWAGGGGRLGGAVSDILDVSVVPMCPLDSVMVTGFHGNRGLLLCARM